MKSEDWKRLEDAKPAPGQEILELFHDGMVERVCYDPILNKHMTHWMPWADPPKPDPFEEYWLAHKDGLPLPKWGHHDTWLACLRWAREHPEELKER